MTIRAGCPPAVSSYVGWLPGLPCENVQQDFCPHANLFCDQEHLAAWCAIESRFAGHTAGLVELASLGSQVWAGVARLLDDSAATRPNVKTTGRQTPSGASGQTEEFGMDVTLLYFAGCPNWRQAEQNLSSALALDDLTDTVVSYQRVETVEDAARVGFTGSPTVLIDGTDPFATPDESVGLSCRLYSTPSGPAGSPTVGAAACRAHPGSARCSPVATRRRLAAADPDSWLSR